VYATRLSALFGLAFAPAPRLRRLTLPRSSNSPAHYAKGTRSGLPSCDGIALPPLVGKRFQVLFHSPHRGSFRLSLTVLVHYRSTGHYPSQVPPFGHPRIGACLRLPEAYRSLPRPSSLPGAKASTVRP